MKHLNGKIDGVVKYPRQRDHGIRWGFEDIVENFFCLCLLSCYCNVSNISKSVRLLNKNLDLRAKYSEIFCFNPAKAV